MKEGFLQCLLDIAEGTDMYVRTLCRYYFTEIVVTVVWYLVLKYYLKRKNGFVKQAKVFSFRKHDEGMYQNRLT